VLPAKSVPRYLTLVLLAIALLAGCRTSRKAQEVAYVSTPQAFLRDRVAVVYTKTGIVKNGDRVQILDRDRRFAKVRTSNGTEGWLEQRYLVSQKDYNSFQKLAQENQSDPVQGSAVTRNETNLHLDPSRDSEHLYQLTSGAKLSILKRATSEKIIPGAPAQAAKGSAPVSVPMEDWWLIRDAEGHVGWLLGRMVDLDVPLDIAQYAEGQRIVAAFVLNQVSDGDKKIPQYLVVLTEPKDGMPFDFNQVRIFTWNVKRHRYETAYRERNLNGVLPVTVEQENFDKEGVLPTFVLRVKDDSGNISERKYKLNTPIVKRVLAPGEQPPPRPSRKRRKR
jgi:SH3-like domain-containing protein